MGADQQMDVAEGELFEHLAAFAAADAMGTLTALVANAGNTGPKARVDELTLGRVERILAVNVEFLLHGREETGSGQNMGVVVGDLACAKVSSLRGGLPWTYGLQ